MIHVLETLLYDLSLSTCRRERQRQERREGESNLPIANTMIFNPHERTTTQDAECGMCRCTMRTGPPEPCRVPTHRDPCTANPAEPK